MTEKQYQETLRKTMEEINEGVSLQTIEEEYEYRKRIVNDLIEWVEEFKQMYSL